MLTTAFAKVGFSGDYGGSWFLTRLVGPGKAKELYYLSDRLDIDEAAPLGLVNRVLPKDGFEDAWRPSPASWRRGPPSPIAT